MQSLTCEELYQKNLEIFKTHSGEASLTYVEEAGTSCLTITETEHGVQEWHYAPQSGSPTLLHSRRDPQREAARLVDKWQEKYTIDWKSAVIVIGFAGMFHIAEIGQRLSNDPFLIVIEPDAALFKHALHYCDLSKLISDDFQLFFVVGNNDDELSSTLKCLLRESVHLNISIVSHPTCERLNHDHYAAIQSRIRSEVRIVGMNRATHASFSDEWMQNCLLNYPLLFKHPGVEALVDTFKGKPAVVVGAGPTLEQSIDYLKNIQNRAFIVAVGQALRRLLQAGIYPDMVVAVDSDPKTLKQYNGLQQHQIWMLAGDNLYPPVIEAFDDRVFGFSNALPAIREWLKECDAVQGSLQVGGTVAISAIDSAVITGCNPIILTGIDLAYLEDGTTHATNTQWAHVKKDEKQMIRVPGNRTETVFTDRQFAVYIDIMNSYLTDEKQVKDRQIYNATTGGARFSGATLIDPEEMLPLALHESYDFKKHLKNVHDSSNIPDSSKVNEHLDSTMNGLTSLKEIIADSLDIVSRYRKNDPNGSALLEKLAENDESMKLYETALQLINCAIMSTCLNIISERDTDENEDDPLASSRTLYSHIAGGADWLIGLLENCQKEYNKEI